MNNLIERYLNQVGNHLPEKGKGDMLAEIGSLIEDMLEDSGSDAGDEQTVSAALSELGSPKKMAASFQPERYLIGPKIYPAFLYVFKIVLAAVLGAYALGIILSFIQTAVILDYTNVILTILKAVPGLVMIILLNFGIMVFIFTIIERTNPNFKIENEDWNPDELPAIESEAPYNQSKLLLKIAATVLFAILLNFFPNWFGMVFLLNLDSSSNCDSMVSKEYLIRGLGIKAFPWT